MPLDSVDKRFHGESLKLQGGKHGLRRVPVLPLLPAHSRQAHPTVIKCKNLKVMDITGYSNPSVRVSLLCDGWRLKKQKTTRRRAHSVLSTMRPLPLTLLWRAWIKSAASCMDYDRGDTVRSRTLLCGISAEGSGRHPWNGMLACLWKPFPHQHSLVRGNPRL